MTLIQSDLISLKIIPWISFRKIKGWFRILESIYFQQVTVIIQLPVQDISGSITEFIPRRNMMNLLASLLISTEVIIARQS